MSYKREVLRWNPDTEQMETLYSENGEAKTLHFIIGDEIEPVLHPVDGQYYTSKSAIRQVTRAAGLEEVGGSLPLKNPEPKRVEKERLLDAYQYAREHLRDKTNLRQYREKQRERYYKMRDMGLVE